MNNVFSFFKIPSNGFTNTWAVYR